MAQWWEDSWLHMLGAKQPSGSEQLQHTIAGVINVRRHRLPGLDGFASFQGGENLTVGDPPSILLGGKEGQPVDVLERKFQSDEHALIARDRGDRQMKRVVRHHNVADLRSALV